MRQPNAIVHTLARAPVYSTLSSGKARTQNVKPHAGRPPLVFSPHFCTSSHIIFFLHFFSCRFLVVTVAHALPRSLSPSVSLQHIFLSQLSSLISFSFLTHAPRPDSPHPSPPSHHLCSCIKVSQCSPASSKLTFPPFKKPPLAR